MNTIATPEAPTTDSSAAPAVAARRPRRRLIRLFASLILSFGAVVGLTTATTGAAHAASYVEGCFRSTQAGYGFAGTPYSLQAYWQGSWYTIFNGNLNRNSCGAVNIGGSNQNYPVKMVVSQRVGTAFFYGSTYTAPAGSGRWNLGTGTVVCSGCR
ncbi:MAG: hypothetical protein JWP10_190 [Nocardioidaceae bacterium]|nr:hypothetical protein [Nocardioidaceae bacterium]